MSPDNGTQMIFISTCHYSRFSLLDSNYITILSLKTKLYVMIMEIKDPGTVDFASNLSLQDNKAI